MRGAVSSEGISHFLSLSLQSPPLGSEVQVFLPLPPSRRPREGRASSLQPAVFPPSALGVLHVATEAGPSM